MVALDVFASSPWYVDHLGPVWLALPAEARGRFHVSAKSADAAKGLPRVTLARPTGLGPILTASYSDYRAAAMLGRAHIALGQHGAGQSYSDSGPAYPGGRGQERASLFLVPNEHAAKRSRIAYPRARVEVVGCPKLDILPHKDRDGEPVVAFSFHWDSRTVPELRSAWYYYQRALLEVAKHHRVIGHAHPRAISMIGRWYRKAGIEIVADFDDVLRRADVYACDNSSSLFEFASTGRPVVVLNEPSYRRNVSHGLRFWDAAGVGVNVDTPGELLAAVGRAIEDPPEVRAERERALDIVYTPRSGGAEAAAAVLVDWAGSLVEPVTPQRRIDVRANRLYGRTRPIDRSRVRT